MQQVKSRCDWCQGSELYQNYHDNEWGVPLHDDQMLFEFLLLEGAQAGLSWITILNKRENYRLAFDNFNPHKIANYSDDKHQELLQNPGIIRNKLKIKAFTKNAKAYLAIIEQYGSFNRYIWQFVQGKTIQNKWESMDAVPATSPESELMSKTLKKAGFTFVGPTICYAFMQATGMVNDHLVSCFRYKECKQLANTST